MRGDTFHDDIAEDSHDEEMIDVGETEELRFKKIILTSQKTIKDEPGVESIALVPTHERSHSFSIAELIRK